MLTTINSIIIYTYTKMAGLLRINIILDGESEGKIKYLPAMSRINYGLKRNTPIYVPNTVAIQKSDVVQFLESNGFQQTDNRALARVFLIPRYVNAIIDKKLVKKQPVINSQSIIKNNINVVLSLFFGKNMPLIADFRTYRIQGFTWNGQYTTSKERKVSTRSVKSSPFVNVGSRGGASNKTKKATTSTKNKTSQSSNGRRDVYSVEVTLIVTMGLDKPKYGRRLAVSCRGRRDQLRKTIKEMFDHDIGQTKRPKSHLSSTDPMYSKRGVSLKRGTRRLLAPTVSNLLNIPQLRSYKRQILNPYTQRTISPKNDVIPVATPNQLHQLLGFTPMTVNQRFSNPQYTALQPLM